MRKTPSHNNDKACVTFRLVSLGLLVMCIFLCVPAHSQDNNGPWTPEQSKTADHVPGTPSDPRGFYPPTQSSGPSPASGAPAPTAAPAPAPSTPSHYSSDNNGPWTPEQSKTADHVPGTPSDPRGFYPPTTGSPNDKPTDLTYIPEAIATSNLANPLIQGGKAIGRTYEASDRGDMTAVAIEATDGIGRLSAIGLGATEGAAWGSAFGPVGTAIGGIIGGFIGNSAWNATGGAINESSRQMLDQQRAREQAQQIRGISIPRPASGGGGGDCGRH